MSDPTITAATAEHLCDCVRDGGVCDGWTRIDGGAPNRTTRWHERYWLVLRDRAGDLWGLDYGVGLTEYQEDDLPWEGAADDKPLPLVRLTAREVTTTVYEPA